MNPNTIALLIGFGIFGTWLYYEFEIRDKFNRLFDEYILPRKTFKELPPTKKTRIVAISLFILSVDYFIISVIKGLLEIYGNNLINLYEI